jgi:RNA polymerase sigma factor (sigma-70 family)
VDYQRLFVENLSTIERVAKAVARRHGLAAAEWDEFASQVRFRLFENDYRILRSFEGRSRLSTYLTIVITRIALDFRNERWGRWRPSARALRLGGDAVALERLILRDGHTFDEAVQILRVNHGSPRTDAELTALWATLPSRHGVSFVGTEFAESVPSTASGEGAVQIANAQEGARVASALEQVVSGLGEDDQVLLKLHFVHGVRLARIAERSGVSKATVQRRLVRLLADIRGALEARGVSAESLRTIAEGPDSPLEGLLGPLRETP